MPSVREKSYTEAGFLDESNTQLRATAGYIYLQRVWQHVLLDNNALLVISRLRVACLDEIGADLDLLWTCTDLLLDRW